MLALLLFGPCLLAVSQDASLADVNRLGRDITERVRAAGGNLLTQVETLRGLQREYTEKGPVALDVLALYTMERTVELGNYAEALRLADRGRAPSGPASPEQIAELEGYEAVDALEAITDLARDELLVFINEAHHVPQHRAFTLELLRALRPLGFTHFAAETLYETDSYLNERGFPTKASGAYIDEPVYGSLVRTALELGYVVVPYESMGESVGGGGDRELGQARNLIERTLEAADDARVIVHAGYAHIDEDGRIAGSRTMAARVKEITGIDPLTIDQTVMSEHGSPEFEHPIYRHVVEARGFSRPVLLVGAEGEPWTLEPGRRDVTLFHPRSVYEHGRPHWLRMGGLRRFHELPRDVLGPETRVLVEARAVGESPDAVPVDRVEVVAGAPIPALVLPAGEFWLEVENVGDETLRKAKIRVR